MTDFLQTTHQLREAFAKIKNKKFLVVGNDKGKDIDSRVKIILVWQNLRVYRKAQRLFKIASKFNLPIVSFIDTLNLPFLELRLRTEVNQKQLQAQ